MSESKSLPRKPRVDATRNREHILYVARELFAEDGSKVTLDEVVKRSGLGVGTLYRHFPTREALLEAMYISEVEKLAAAQPLLSDSLPPVEALRQWMSLFIDFMATKYVLREAVGVMVGSSPEASAASTKLIQSSINALAERAEAAGEIKLNVEPLDLLRALSGFVSVGEGAEWKDRAKQFIDVLIAGVRVSP